MLFGFNIRKHLTYDCCFKMDIAEPVLKTVFQGISCCGASCKLCNKNKVFTVVVISFGIIHLAIDWWVFAEFAKQDFSTVLGAKNEILFRVWITVISAATFLTFIEIVLQIQKLVRKEKETYNGQGSESLETNGGIQLQQLKERLLDSDDQTRTHNATEESRDGYICGMLAILIFKALFQNGGSAMVGVIIALSCKINESTTDNAGQIEIRYILLLTSWGINSLSALLNIARMCLIVRKRRNRWCCSGGSPALVLMICHFVLLALGAAAFSFFLFAFFIKFITAPSFNWSTSFAKTEISLYLSTRSGARDICDEPATFVANFSNIYESGSDGLQHYVNRGTIECYVYRVKFDRHRHIVVYSRGVFLPERQLNQSILSDQQVKDMTENGTMIPCHPCPETGVLDAVSRVCSQENVTLHLVGYESDADFSRYYQCSGYQYDQFHGCISEKSRYAVYSSNMSPCTGSSALACYGSMQ